MAMTTNFKLFCRQLIKVARKHAPLKIASRGEIKQLVKPWITKGMRTSIKIKNRFYKIIQIVRAL